MRTLAHSARRVAKNHGGEYLPPVFLAMEQRGMRSRLGTATFIMGPPGAMKTAFALYYTLRLGQPLLYFSADSEEFEVVERAAAQVTGTPMSIVASDHARYIGALDDLSYARFCFESSPSYGGLVEEIAAYTEVEGQFPRVIVIDTMMKVVGESDDEWASLRDTAQVVHEVTRITGAKVFVVHHASDDRVAPTTPASRNKLQGKVSHLPKEIWSVAADGNRFHISPVKSKITREDPSGQDYVTLYVDASTGRFFNTAQDMERGVPA